MRAPYTKSDDPAVSEPKLNPEVDKETICLYEISYERFVENLLSIVNCVVGHQFSGW